MTAFDIFLHNLGVKTEVTKQRSCPICTALFEPTTSNQRFCCDGCKQDSYVAATNKARSKKRITFRTF